MTEDEIALTQLPDTTAANANQILQVNTAGTGWDFEITSATRFNEATAQSVDNPDVHLLFPTFRTRANPDDESFAGVGVSFDAPNAAGEGGVTFFVDVANTGRPGVITSEQFSQLEYLPILDTTLTPNTQYAFVRDADDAADNGTWQTVTVPTLSVNDPTTGDDSVTIRTRIGTTDHGVVTFTGDSTVNISSVGNTVNFTGHSVSPPTHDPYSITITSTPADGATIDGRRIDITPGEEVSVEFNVASTDLTMWNIHEINTLGIDGASGAAVTNTSTPNLNGMYSATLTVPETGTTSGTYTMHFTVVYDEITQNAEGEDVFVQRFTREEQYTVVIEESFYLGLLSEAPTAIACLLYTSPSPRDRQKSRMPSSA